ncbi:hypothetical protein J2045_003512 [Peteryoungia aggregata LMG 23059]|uniref:Uncharacterized protein n=1 Tax=Peteryoungia aggregata LMG 23059 TaxID=1368425 RepID=A0ABU0GAT0_9HYPH|nr:hypothetical protein [Peteryoungia aggregata]MDQ0422464.1 hypothetical protein [Peteryoungia aggregata LMG 23059]
MRTLALFVLAGISAFSLWRLGDVERERYALILGMCRNQSTLGLDANCLETVEPRESRLWDIYYGLAQ